MQAFRSIQCLRAFAALMVVAHHAMTPAEGFEMIGGAADFLAAGVDVFFVISGFIIYLSQLGRSGGAFSFLKRRFIRVVPMYWLVTAVLVACHLVLGISRDMSLAPEHVVASILLLPHYSPSHPGHLWPLLIPGWSLVYELFFYATFALALALTPRFAAVTMAAALGVLVGLGAILQPQSAWAVAYTSPLLLEFLAGMGLAALVARQSLSPLLAVALPIGMALLVQADLAETPRILAWGVPAVLIVTGTVALEAFTSATWVERIGDGSYSIYLSHPITLSFARGLWRHLHLAGSGVAGFVAFGFLASLVVGMVVHIWIERPLSARLGKWAAKTPGRVSSQAGEPEPTESGSDVSVAIAGRTADGVREQRG